MKKVIFINRFFYPDHSATSQILTDLVFNLQLDDYEIHVVTGRLSYDGMDRKLEPFERIDNVYIHRVWSTRFGRERLHKRMLDYLTFYVAAFFKIFRLVRKNDILVAKTDPPMISVLAAIVAKTKRARLVNWLQDLFPEVARGLHVRCLTKGVIYKVLKYIRNWSLKRAVVNVAICDIMKEMIEMEIDGSSRVEVIHNWVIGENIQPVTRESNRLRLEWNLDNKFVVGYSGNLGRAHDYDTILYAIEKMQSVENIVFLFIGSGAGMVELMTRVREKKLHNVLFKPYQPIDMLSDSLSLPDVHLLTLKPSMEGLIFPSKIYGIIAVARPVIFIGSSIGEMSRILERYDCGYIAEIGDTDKLINAICELSDDANIYQYKTNMSAKLYKSEFSYGRSIRSWENIIKSVGG